MAPRGAASLFAFDISGWLSWFWEKFSGWVQDSDVVTGVKSCRWGMGDFHASRKDPLVVFIGKLSLESGFSWSREDHFLLVREEFSSLMILI